MCLSFYRVRVGANSWPDAQHNEPEAFHTQAIPRPSTACKTQKRWLVGTLLTVGSEVGPLFPGRPLTSIDQGPKFDGWKKDSVLVSSLSRESRAFEPARYPGSFDPGVSVASLRIGLSTAIE